MKKISKLVVSMLVLASLALAGCSSGGKNSTETTGAKEPTKSTNEQSKIKVGFLLSGPVNDGGYNYNHDRGRQIMEKETGVETIYKESVKEDSAEVQKVIEDMINQGANVIIGPSFGFMDGMLAAAKKHPDITFLHGGGHKQEANLSNFFGREYEARYLSGIAAGMKTKSNKLGFVAAFPIPEIIRGINAFTLGAKSVNPDVVVKVTWTNTWYDPAKEKEAAKALIAQGADVIGQHQNTAGAQQASEEAGIFSVGYNVDMSKAAPKANLTSDIFNWGVYYTSQIKAIQEGTWKSESYWGGIKDGLVDIAPLTDNVAPGTKEAVEKAKASVVSGENKIFVGPIKDQTGAVKVPGGSTMADDEIFSMKWFVEGVEGTIPK